MQLTISIVFDANHYQIAADAPNDEEAHSSDVNREAEHKMQSVHITCEEYVGENLDEILQRIQDYHGLWKIIGAELGIEVDVLDTIEKNYQQDIDRLHALIIHLPYADSSQTYQAFIKAFKSERASDAIAGRYIVQYQYLLMTIIVNTAAIVPKVTIDTISESVGWPRSAVFYTCKH